MPENELEKLKLKLLHGESPVVVDNTSVRTLTEKEGRKLEDSRQRQVAYEDEMRRRREAAARVTPKEAREQARAETEKLLKTYDANSEDATSIYETFASPEDLQTMETAKGIGLSIATLPFTVGTTGGWWPGAVSTVGGYVGSDVGSQMGYRFGQYLDKKYGGNTTPYLTFTGGFMGGAVGGSAGAKVATSPARIVNNVSNGKILTHGIEPKNFIKIANGKGNKSLPNPSLMATSADNGYNGYGDVVLLGDESLLKNSYFFNGDGGTSTVGGLGSSVDDIVDVREVSRRMKHLDDLSQMPRISELDLRKRVSSNPYDYAEVKRIVPTPITDFKHAFVSKINLTPELQNALKNSGIPFTITTNPIDFEIKSFVSQNPQFIGKKGGKIKTQA